MLVIISPGQLNIEVYVASNQCCTRGQTPPLVYCGRKNVIVEILNIGANPTQGDGHLSIRYVKNSATSCNASTRSFYTSIFYRGGGEGHLSDDCQPWTILSSSFYRFQKVLVTVSRDRRFVQVSINSTKFWLSLAKISVLICTCFSLAMRRSVHVFMRQRRIPQRAL